MASQFLLQGLAQGGNPTAQAFDAKTQQLQQGHDADRARQRDDQRFKMEQDRLKLDEQSRKDNDIKTIIDYAADGYTEEAKYLMQQKNIQLPEQIITNSLFAKGAKQAAERHPDDPAAREKFLIGWHQKMSEGISDDIGLYQAGAAAGGIPVSPDDRKYNYFLRELKAKKKYGVGDGTDRSFTLGEGQTRYDAGGNIVARGPDKRDDGKVKFVQDAVSSALNNAMNPSSVDTAKIANDAASIYDQMVASAGAKGPTQTPPMSGGQTQQGSMQKGVYAIQQLMLKGYAPDQIKARLIQGGASEEQADALVRSATGGQ